LALAGITDMAAANRYLEQIYRPAFNAEFAQPAREAGSAFVPYIGPPLDEVLCESFECAVGNDNCVQFERLLLQIPPDVYRCHYVKAHITVRRHLNGTLSVGHGQRCLARFDACGQPIKDEPRRQTEARCVGPPHARRDTLNSP
jgi:hypothetical protein